MKAATFTFCTERNTPATAGPISKWTLTGKLAMYPSKSKQKARVDILVCCFYRLKKHFSHQNRRKESLTIFENAFKHYKTAFAKLNSAVPIESRMRTEIVGIRECWRIKNLVSEQNTCNYSNNHQ